MLNNLKKSDKVLLLSSTLFLILTLLLFGIVEFGFKFALKKPKLFQNTALMSYLQLYYRDFSNIKLLNENELVQYDKSCLYTLIPGAYEHTEVEFEIDLLINRMGVRDDQRSLYKPEVIILGDEQVMGWGVEEEAVYASLLEELSGKRVLNLGVLKMPTCMTWRFLERFDLSGLQYLIIHYSDRYKKANRAAAFKFLPKEFHITNFFYWYRQHNETFNDFPGRRALSFLLMLQDKLTNKSDKSLFESGDIFGSYLGESVVEIDDKGEAWDFLENSKSLLKLLASRANEAKVLIFEANEYARNDDKFVEELQKLCNERAEFNSTTNELNNKQSICAWLNKSKFIKMADIFTPKDHYPLCGRLNATGHAKLAQKLTEILKQFETQRLISKQASAPKNY